ncbi:MAG: ComEC/Rec2 family competence protein [Mucilaginibacter sp.]
MIPAHKGEIPFVVFIIPFLTGIASGIWFPTASFVFFVEITLIVASTAFIVLNVAYKQFRLYKVKWFGGAILQVILFLFGWWVVANNSELNDNNHFSTKHADYLLVKINNEPKLTTGLLRFTGTVEANVLKGEKIDASGNLLITVKDSTANHLYYGDELLIPANFSLIEPPFNPAEFNYKQYLANQNIHYQSFLYAHQFYVLNKNAGNPIVAYSLRLRQRLIDKFKSNMRSPEAIAVASTLILGYKADLSNDVLQAYSQTGTVHVLSVSGAHVAILFILLSFSLSFLDKIRYGKTIKALLIIVFIWSYALLTGFSPAVCRAAVMISMVIIGKTYSRHINTLNIMAISAFFLLLYNPLYITDVGFQLSYLAVSGLIILQPIIYKWLDLESKWTDKLWALCSVSIAAQIITFPLSAFYFHQFPVYFLVSNLFIIIPSAVIMYAGITYLLLPQIPFISMALGWILEKSILLMNKVLTLIEHAPYSSINKIWITKPEYLLLYAITFSFFYLISERKPWVFKLSLFLILLFAISISTKRWNNLKSDNIAFLNLRNHSGIIFKTGDQAVVLSDMNDSDKIYKYSIQPYLDSCQVANVKMVLPRSDIQVPFFLKKSNLIQFKNKKLLIFNKQLAGLTLLKKLKLDYIYITDNPATDFHFINSNYDCSSIIIASDNTNTLVTRLENDANKIHTNYRILKRNKSVVISSN